MSKFVTIQKGNMVNRVSYAAYRNFFESSGWSIVGEEDSPTSPIEEEVVESDVEETENDVADADEENVDDEVADEEWEEAIAEEEVEKPLSEMNREELIAKANSLGVEVGKKNNKQLREAIKEVM